MNCPRGMEVPMRRLLVSLLLVTGVCGGASFAADDKT
jgi:hypothetical protein